MIVMVVTDTSPVAISRLSGGEKSHFFHSPRASFVKKKKKKKEEEQEELQQEEEEKEKNSMATVRMEA